MEQQATQATTTEQAQKFDIWACVEVMGHRKYAGRATEQVVAGVAFIRVDVPEVTDARGAKRAAYAKLIGPGSIYMISPTTEEMARRAAAQLARDGDDFPVYIPPERPRIPASTGLADPDFTVIDELPF